MYILESHSDFFPQDQCSLSDEQAERLDEDHLLIEKCYEMKLNIILGEDSKWTNQKPNVQTNQNCSF